jgi:hypothetical protein
LVTPVPLSPLLLLCCAYGGGSIKISLQAMPYNLESGINIPDPQHWLDLLQLFAPKQIF